LVAHPTAVLAFNATDELDIHGKVVRQHRLPYPLLNRGLEMHDRMLHGAGSPIFGIVMVRRAAVLAAGAFDPRIPTLADVDMWLRMLRSGDAVYVPEPLYGIYPRENDHYNNMSNWRIVRENELISRLNVPRRYPQRSPEGVHAWKAAERSLWRKRLQRLRYCLKHGLAGKFFEGLKLCMERPIPNPWREASP
jgi:hypothetical protein